MDKLGKRPPSGTPLESTETIAVGQWYWIKNPYDSEEAEYKAKEYLSCVVHVGSNYVEVDPVTCANVRIHLDVFNDKCRLEPDPDPIINQKIADAQTTAARLMGEVHELTARLALGTEPGLGTGAEGQALAKLDTSVSADTHKAALIEAKEKTLPELFKGIESAHGRAATWMTAKVIPLKASANIMKGSIEVIEGRIFNVELYAGLTEEVTLIRDGEPAGVSEKVHLMQRMHYMDEECLARYETGGMSFKDIKQFDVWLSKNMERLLPTPKCMIAFRVRRNKKDIAYNGNLFSFIQLILEREHDKLTYLYIRNGDRVYRMSTALEFGAKLFPDMTDTNQGEQQWVQRFAGRISDDALISQGEYEEMKQQDEEQERERQKKYKAASKKDRWQYQFPISQRHKDYEPFNQKSVFYDDILKRETKRLEKHNRIALILQGLLDRSEVFHPHPAWRIWTPEGFNQALELVYDDSRALVAGAKPDFEAYRARINASIGVGTVTIGQERVWLRREADKYNAREDRNWRRQNHYDVQEHRPYGNPGPGLIARVAEMTKTKCLFKWNRRRLIQDYWEKKSPTIPCSIYVDKGRLFNLDSYTPGDFRQFYDDPRTRAEYLKWAPLLIRAEEYKAGNLKVGPEEE